MGSKRELALLVQTHGARRLQAREGVLVSGILWQLNNGTSVRSRSVDPSATHSREPCDKSARVAQPSCVSATSPRVSPPSPGSLSWWIPGQIGRRGGRIFAGRESVSGPITATGILMREKQNVFLGHREAATTVAPWCRVEDKTFGLCGGASSTPSQGATTPGSTQDIRVLSCSSLLRSLSTSRTVGTSQTTLPPHIP